MTKNWTKREKINILSSGKKSLYNEQKIHQEEVFSKLNGGKIFSKLDLSEAYLQIQVEEVCAHLLTINTHRGSYKFKQLPFGVKVAPATFQQVMNAMLNDCNLAIAYLEDIFDNERDGGATHRTY
ncbi:uncharacterized protein K02A2.6-like [Octopus sinensis]|uniref:Uncharacterized protein K02A2.6-like n=1 Tax=Octopus sinensis TaxID=2607531 RepID=A0A6P7TVZ3_9MOLL|nr:uncharacterized protein K02A2.6-like [Octopus sinensis]